MFYIRSVLLSKSHGKVFHNFKLISLVKYILETSWMKIVEMYEDSDVSYSTARSARSSIGCISARTVQSVRSVTTSGSGSEYASAHASYFKMVSSPIFI